jgi:hypothetical protein
MFSSSELIKKYSIKCKENENLQKQLKQLSALLKEYQSKLMNAVTKQMPLEEVRNMCAMGKDNRWCPSRIGFGPAVVPYLYQ